MSSRSAAASASCGLGSDEIEAERLCGAPEPALSCRPTMAAATSGTVLISDVGKVLDEVGRMLAYVLGVVRVPEEPSAPNTPPPFRSCPAPTRAAAAPSSSRSRRCLLRRRRKRRSRSSSSKPKTVRRSLINSLRHVRLRKLTEAEDYASDASLADSAGLGVVQGVDGSRPTVCRSCRGRGRS